MPADSRALARQRPPTPADAEYDSICAAVMETVRGRWFLAEYSRRNRHADTQIILAAIDQLETALRTKTPVSGSERLAAELTKAMEAIEEARGVIALSQASARASEEIQLSLTTMRELADVMRQKGVDSLYCTQLEARIASLDAALAPQEAPDSQARLAALLDQLHARVEAMLASLNNAEAAAETVSPAAASAEPNASRPNLSVVPSTATEAIDPIAQTPGNAEMAAAPASSLEPMKPAVLLDLSDPPTEALAPTTARFDPPVEPFVAPSPAAVASPIEAASPPPQPETALGSEPPTVVTSDSALDAAIPDGEPAASFVPFEFEALGVVDFANTTPGDAPAAVAPPEIAAEPPLTVPPPPADPLAAILALSDEERIALFS
ncbi:MAG TPA: hypothetical protein VFB45_09380 [Pseudolabrys sp.]|nr:hypothetical protein [Pseudolabrys sp.]